MTSAANYLKSNWHILSIALLVLGNSISIAFSTTYAGRQCHGATAYWLGADTNGIPSSACGINSKNECAGNCSGSGTSQWISGQCSIVNPESTCNTGVVEKPIYDYTLKCGIGPSNHSNPGCGCWAYIESNNPKQKIEVVDCV